VAAAAAAARQSAERTNFTAGLLFFESTGNYGQTRTAPSTHS